MVNVQVKVLHKKARKGGCLVLLFDTFKELKRSNFWLLPALSLYQVEYTYKIKIKKRILRMKEFRYFNPFVIGIHAKVIPNSSMCCLPIIVTLLDMSISRILTWALLLSKNMSLLRLSEWPQSFSYICSYPEREKSWQGAYCRTAVLELCRSLEAFCENVIFICVSSICISTLKVRHFSSTDII